MNARIETPLRRAGVVRGIFALSAVVASLFVLATPASADPTRCVKADDGNLVVQVDESPSGNTVLTMANGVLFVNGESCGSPTPSDISQTSITVIELGSIKPDTVIFDLKAGPFRANGVAVFINLKLQNAGPNGRDKVKIKGTSGIDEAAAKPDFLRVDRIAEFAPDDRRVLSVSTANSNNLKAYFILRGGNDDFGMIPDNNGVFYFGFLSIKGGPGDDFLRGGPLRQRIRGGSGNDIIWGGSGNDILFGNSGADIIKGNAGKDKITGGSGKDRVFGGSGADRFFMADGTKDTVKGGRGADTCDCDGNDTRRSVKAI